MPHTQNFQTLKNFTKVEIIKNYKYDVTLHIC